MRDEELYRSSSSRRLPLRARLDLQVRRESFSGGVRFVVRNPLSGAYVVLDERELFLLQSIDGESSLDSLKKAYEQRFAEYEASVEQLHHFVLMLQKKGLLESLSPGDGERLHSRKRENARRLLLSALMNPLSIKLPGISPAPVLRVLTPAMGWFFSPLPALSVALLAMFTAFWVLLHAGETAARFPDWRDLTQPTRLVSWLFLLAGLKCLHELGHAVACEKMGARCRAIGVMLLMFSPCLYCNVTDVWSISSKWKRAAVSLAGVYVEMTVAIVAAWLWWWSKPGFFQDACFQAAVSGSLTTFFFNANPLMKYDGYYLLCDAWEIPDLAERSRRLMFSALRSLLMLGDDDDKEWRRKPQAVKMLAYGAASTLYRAIMMLSVTYIFWRWAREFGLTPIAAPVLALAWLGACWKPIRAFHAWFTKPASSSEQTERQRRFRIGVALGGFAVLLPALPLPTYVDCEVKVHPSNAAQVYVQTAGRVMSVYAQPGETVLKGTPLARLHAAELELSVAEANKQLKAAEVRISSLRRNKGTRDAEQAMAEAEERVARLKIWKAALERDFANLTLLAPRDGVIIPPPVKPFESETALQLASWHGVPSEPENLGCHVEPGALWCEVVDPLQTELRMGINANDRDLIAPGQAVHVQLSCDASRIDLARLVEVSATVEEKEPAQALSTAPSEVLVEASGLWAGQAPPSPLYASGRGRIAIGWRNWYWRVFRFVRQTFQQLN